MKTCPYCFSDIVEQALKCKHCGEWVTDKPASSSSRPSSAEFKTTISSKSNSDHQGFFEVLQGALTLLRRILGVERRAIRVGAPELHDTWNARLVAPASRVACELHGRSGCTVVAAIHREHLVASGVAACEAYGVLDRIGAPVGEEHPVEIAGSELGNQARLCTAVERSDGSAGGRFVGPGRVLN